MDIAAPVVAESIRAYYERRADEYDDWWLGTGSFAARNRPSWPDEVVELITLIGSLRSRRTLDVACGTAFLTQHLGGEIVGVDQSPAMIAVARERLPTAEFICAEAVPLPFEDESFELVFASHFYGHLLTEERSRFLAEALRVGKQLVVVDAAQRADVSSEEWQRRELGDGSVHRVYKRYFTAPGLARELGGGSVLHAGRWFVAASIEAGPRSDSGHAVR
jgi:ubiquinone/menaquinone biosynthesis C-methylase UbiE